MNFKKKMKRFFTLSRSAEGFTLVELVVCIVILAILSAIAIPAYGQYVEATDMGLDRALVGEIKSALSVGYYAGFFEGGASVSLGMTSAELKVSGGDGVVQSLNYAFGDDYASQLVLKYDGWEVTGGGAGNTGLKVFFAVMSLLHAIAILAFLYLRKEMFRPRCLWMSLASAAVVLLVLMALILNFPSPKPLAAPQLAALMMQLHI